MVCSCKSTFTEDEDDDTFDYYILTTLDGTSLEFPTEGGVDSVFVHANCSWTIDIDCDWIHVDKTIHEGDGMVIFTIDKNETPVKRYSEVEVQSPGRKRIIKIQISQTGSSKLFTYSSFDQAVGYGYDLTAPYPNGTTFAIFNIPHLDYMQYVTGHNYIVDNDQPEMTEEVFSASSEQELEDQINAKIGVGISYNGMEVDVSASVDYKTLESIDRQYAMKKVRRTVFSRNLQYMNVVADEMDGVRGLFAPEFEKDWIELCESEGLGTYVIREKSSAFIKKWGKAFVCTSLMGAGIDYEIEVESSVLTTEFGITVAVDASLAGIVNADVNGYYKEKLTEMNSHYNKSLKVRGGDVKIMSILNTGGTISKEAYEQWQNSVLWKDGLMSDNVVLSDVKIVSIAELFTGRVKEELARMIKQEK